MNKEASDESGNPAVASNDSTHEPTPAKGAGVIAQLERFQSAIAILVGAPIAVMTAFLFIDERYAKSSDVETLAARMPIASERYVQESIVAKTNELSERVIVPNLDNVARLGDVVSNHRRELDGLPIKIETYTDCIVNSLQEFANIVALRESRAIGLQTSRIRQAQFEVFCAGGGDHCSHLNLVSIFKTDGEGHKMEIDRADADLREIRSRIANCSSKLRDDVE